jgi:integrase
MSKKKHPSHTISSLAALWLASDCPDGRLEARTAVVCEQQRARINTVCEFAGNIKLSDISLSMCVKYAAWRKEKALQGTGEVSADMDLQVLSNALNWAASSGMIPFNPILRRPRFRKARDVVHCRERAPRCIDDVHLVARELFQSKASQVLGWQMLFEAHTGARTNEVLGMKYGVSSGPGYWNVTSLYIQRSKHGINPWIPMTPILHQMLKAHAQWHKSAFPFSPWMFPGQDGIRSVTPGALTRKLAVECKKAGYDKWTSHGMRSLYVTIRRSQGISDAQIAGEIGDRTVSLISTTYGDRPPNWAGGEVLSFEPVAYAWEYLP